MRRHSRACLPRRRLRRRPSLQQAARTVLAADDLQGLLMQRAQTVAVPDADDGGMRQSCLQQVVERGFGFFVECRGRLIHK